MIKYNPKRKPFEIGKPFEVFDDEGNIKNVIEYAVLFHEYGDTETECALCYDSMLEFLLIEEDMKKHFKN